MNGVLALRTSATLCSDPSRVVARLFLPGEEPHLAHSRAGTIAARVLALDEPTIERIAAGLGRDFANRYRDYPRLLERHASVVAAHVDNGVPLSPARTLVLGASFTAEYATEAAALCNPSAFLHPDQRNLEPGQVRVAVSLRAIGEGHISSISFCEAVIGPGPQWSFAQRDVPIVAGEVSPGRWRADQLRAVLEDQGGVDELSNGLLRTLPTQFDASDVERAVARLSADLLTRPGAQDSVDLMRRLVASAYEVDFPADTMLAQRILRPSVAEESDGMEDARFTRFVAADGSGRLPSHLYRLRRAPDRAAAVAQCGPVDTSAHTGCPDPPRATRAWRCSRGWSAAGTWRCVEPTARASAWPARQTATAGHNHG